MKHLIGNLISVILGILAASVGYSLWLHKPQDATGQITCFTLLLMIRLCVYDWWEKE